MLITANAINGEIRPDDWVLVGPMDACRYLVGMVTKIVPPESPEHHTGSIDEYAHVDFTVTDYPQERKEEIEQYVSNLHCEPDDVIMLPENLIRITGIDLDTLSKLLDSREEAKAYCKQMIAGDFEEGAIIGSFYVGGGFEVYVDSKDPATIPHFHVQYNDKPLHACIEFQRPVYFRHDEKQGTLDTEQIERLIEFFQSKPDNRYFTGTNWNLACWDWNKNNFNAVLPEDLEMPDFTKLTVIEK